MPELFAELPPHRRLVGFLEMASDALEEALRMNATVGVLPHWAEGQVREMAETLDALLGQLERAGSHLARLTDDEWVIEATAEDEG
jgi:hypothetical protein